jgi:hypothetical protein
MSTMDERRLEEIANIIEAVDRRCMAADRVVPATKEEITGEELRRIYLLATRKVRP